MVVGSEADLDGGGEEADHQLVREGEGGGPYEAALHVQGDALQTILLYRRR